MLRPSPPENRTCSFQFHIRLLKQALMVRRRCAVPGRGVCGAPGRLRRRAAASSGARVAIVFVIVWRVAVSRYVLTRAGLAVGLRRRRARAFADRTATVLGVDELLMLRTPPTRSRRRTPGAGTGHRARTWNYTLNTASADPPIGSPLVSCDLASHHPESPPGGSRREATIAFHGARTAEQVGGRVLGSPSSVRLLAGRGDRRGAAARRGSRPPPGWTGVTSGPRRGAPAPRA